MFLYFDLGNVLLNFSHDRMCRQMAQAVNDAAPSKPVSAADVKRVLFDDSAGRPAMEWRFERGDMTPEEFHREFCLAVGAEVPFNKLAQAVGEIFWANGPIRAVVGALLAARQPMGILSNTNAFHWKIVRDKRRDELVPGAFRTHALSFEIHAMKPEREMYLRAADLAGVAPGDVFFVDDTPGHVAAAKQAGFDAVQYTTARALASELRARGVEFNL